MSRFFFPVEVVRLRTEQLQSSHSSTFGLVRNSQTQNHQGWDLSAAASTRCYAIAAGHVEWVRNQGAYGQQLAISFNKDGSQPQTSSNQTLLAFYAHLQPGSIQVVAGMSVRAGQFVALSGTSGNAGPNAPHLHFEIRTTTAQQVGLGLANRVDPGTILGYQLYNSSNPQIGGQDHANQMSVVRGMATPSR